MGVMVMALAGAKAWPRCWCQVRAHRHRGETRPRSGRVRMEFATLRAKIIEMPCKCDGGGG